MQEIWKKIPNYDGYLISNMGVVKSVDRLSSNGKHLKGKTLKPLKTSGGYLSISLCKDGKDKHYAIHRLVMLVFVGKCPDGMEVNHIDENKHNNCLSNLEYITSRDNCNHGTRNERIALSNKHPKSKSHCANISKGRKGIIFTEEHKRNISIAKKKQYGDSHNAYNNSNITDYEKKPQPDYPGKGPAACDSFKGV